MLCLPQMASNAHAHCLQQCFYARILRGNRAGNRGILSDRQELIEGLVAELCPHRMRLEIDLLNCRSARAAVYAISAEHSGLAAIHGLHEVLNLLWQRA